MAKKQPHKAPRLGGRRDRLFDSLNAIITQHAMDRIPITHEHWRYVVDTLAYLRGVMGNPPNLHRLTDHLIPLGVEGWITSFDNNRTFPLQQQEHPVRIWFLELLGFLNATRLVTAEVRRTAARALLEAIDRIHFDVPAVRLTWTDELQRIIEPDPAPILIPDPPPENVIPSPEL